MTRRHLLSLCLSLPLLLTWVARSAAVDPVWEPAPGSAERKAIMEALRGPVTKHVGKRVTFTGKVKISGAWATFSEGGAAPTDGVLPKDEALAAELELDLFALLRRTEGGGWKVLHWAFAGDVGPMQEAREKFPAVPKALVPVIR